MGGTSSKTGKTTGVNQTNTIHGDGTNTIKTGEQSQKIKEGGGTSWWLIIAIISVAIVGALLGGLYLFGKNSDAFVDVYNARNDASIAQAWANFNYSQQGST